MSSECRFLFLLSHDRSICGVAHGTSPVLLLMAILFVFCHWLELSGISAPWRRTRML